MFFAVLLDVCLCHTHDHDHACGLDIISRYQENNTLEIKTKRNTLSQNEFEPLRLEMDYSFINGSQRDPQMCHFEGENIEWDEKYICRSADIPSQAKIDALIGTLENVKKFLQGMLKVDRLEEGFYLKNYSSLTSIPSKFVKDVDLHLTVVIRPFNPQVGTVAAAGPSQSENRFYRPIQGFVFINPAYIPTTISDESDWDNEYFYTLLHEITHVLGISNNLYQNYHPKGVSKIHENITCQFVKSGKLFTFLNTPHAHQFAVKHFGEEYFYGDNGEKCWSGIELEDGGGYGTKYSHPESRVYVSEMMVGVNIQNKNGPFNRITDVSVAMLLDTGNYEVNWSYVKPIVWGNKDSIDGKFIDNFATGPAQLVFPSYYMYNSTYNANVGFDFKYIGKFGELIDTTNICPSSSAALNSYCKGSEFYNILKNEKIGQTWHYDFITLKYPSTICAKGEGAIEGMMTCGEYTCDNFDSFEIEIRKADKYNKQLLMNCSKDSVGKTTDFIYKDEWRTYHVTAVCPEPERFCRSVTLNEIHYDSNPLSPDYQLKLIPKSTPIEYKTSKFSIRPITLVIIGISVLIVVIVCLAIYAIVLIIKGNQQSEAKKVNKAQKKIAQTRPDLIQTLDGDENPEQQYHV